MGSFQCFTNICVQQEVSSVVHVKGLSVIVRASLLLCASWGVLALTGCGMGSINHTAQVDVALNGKVHGGQQAVSGATVQLYMVGTGGNGSAASPMIPNGTYYLGGQPGCVASGSTTCYASVISDGNGNFSITGDYTCPTFGTQVYIVATGGNPGLASGTNNLALTMVEALGSCGNLAANTNTSLFIDEVTTAAAAWSLAPFATSATNIGSSATNATGIANAFLDEQLRGGDASIQSDDRDWQALCAGGCALRMRELGRHIGLQPALFRGDAQRRDSAR
jgi:hypothetical protein